MKRSTRIALTAALACAALAAFSVVATAHTARFDSTVTIHFKPNKGDGQGDDKLSGFSGRVNSLKERCERNREVGVLRRLEGPDALVGEDSTDTDGEWEVPVAAVPEGTYYAKAKRKDLRRNSAHVHICRRAVSNDLTVKATP
jgi:hypothetical protein